MKFQKFIISILCLLGIVAMQAEQMATVTGTVYCGDNGPVKDVPVMVSELGKLQFTDYSGAFSLVYLSRRTIPLRLEVLVLCQNTFLFT